MPNADGVTIYYNFTNNPTELQVTYRGYDTESPESRAYAGKVVIPQSVTYEGETYRVSAIGYSAFSNCSSLTEVTIPNSVTSIGDEAFAFCFGLTEVNIPNSVTSIGEGAFALCISLTELTIPGSVTFIGTAAFLECTGLTSLVIPNSVFIIGELAFSGCSGLTELTIGNNVTSIGNEAFSSCSSLTEVTIPNSVTSIGHAAFRYCYGLTKVTIGNGVTSIGDSAFQGCGSLTTLHSLNTTPPYLEIYDFGISGVINTPFDDNHYPTVDVYVPEEALDAYQNANIWKKFQKLHAIDGSTAIAKVSAAEQIQTTNGQITVTGLTDGTTVAVYDLSGRQVGTATSKGGQVNISTGMTAGSAAIVKVGERSVKTVMK